MLDTLTARLSRVVKTLRGEARLTEDNIQDTLREVRLALLEADVALPVVKDFIASIREKALGAEVIGSLTPGQALVGVVQRELAALMGGAAQPTRLRDAAAGGDPAGRAAGRGQDDDRGEARAADREERKKVLARVGGRLPAGSDRSAADAGGAGRASISFRRRRDESPVAIARGALDWARRHFHDVLIVDTAGRLAVDEAMMKEIADLHAAVKPIETLFVVDAMQGQDAVNTARAFSDALPLTGIVLTKLDGDARGGAALSVRHVTGAPIKFAGVSEKIDGLEVFHPERMASRILGMGDVLSLIEEAHRDRRRRGGEEARQEGQDRQGFRPRRLQGADRPDAQDGWTRGHAGQAAGRARARWRRASTVDERKIARVEGIINSMTPRRAREAGDHQGIAQAAHRGRRGGFGAGGEPGAEPVRADAEDDENGRQGRHAETDARDEGHAAGRALTWLRGVQSGYALILNGVERGSALIDRNCGHDTAPEGLRAGRRTFSRASDPTHQRAQQQAHDYDPGMHLP